MSKKGRIYYLPGRGGSFTSGLGLALLDRGWEVAGRQMMGDFQRLRFFDQVQLIAEDLKGDFWSGDTKIVANSFGAYLFLHAQSQLPRFPGRVLLLSPVVGGAPMPGNRGGFIPPHPDRLFELAENGQMPSPVDCEMHVGERDWQSIPDRVSELGRLLNISATVVPEAGHMLDRAYVNALLDRWLA